MKDLIKIPEKRKGVLIGHEGSVKKKIEELTNTRIKINDSIEIEGEPLDVMKTKDIIKAIGRGFSPEKSLKLLDDEYKLSIIELGDETLNSRRRIFSRVIGRKGSTKRRIEESTDTDISVFGKTISIIGRWDNVEKAEKILQLLISGSKHSYIYRLLKEIKGE
jgi:ribosomal RNA assembly protein